MGKNASPTCQYGIYNNLDRVLDTNKTSAIIDETLENIQNGTFSKQLDIEAQCGYKNLERYNKDNKKSSLSLTQKTLNKIIKY